MTTTHDTAWSSRPEPSAAVPTLTDEQVVAVLPALLARLKAGKTIRRRDFYATPDATPSILEQTPRISRGEQSHLFVQLQGGDPEQHPDDVYAVQRVSHLLGADLVAVTTKTTVFLMTDDEYASSVPEEDARDERDARDVASWADGLMCALIAMKDMKSFMSPAALMLWKAGMELAEGGRDQQARLGYALALDGIIASPGLLDQAARELRQALVDADPDLAVLGPAPVPTALAVPRSLQIGTPDFEVLPTGELIIAGRADGAPLVQLTLKESYALLTFLRLPGVATLIEQADAAEQLRSWQGFDADPETIAERASA